MTEREYLHATGLAALRIALDALKRVQAPTGELDRDVAEARRLVALAEVHWAETLPELALTVEGSS